jgi:hypothetical protein
LSNTTSFMQTGDSIDPVNSIDSVDLIISADSPLCSRSERVCHVNDWGSPWAIGLRSDRSQPLENPIHLVPVRSSVLSDSVGLHLKTDLTQSVLMMF